MTIRLIASDLDGTLFGPDHVPEPRTVAAVNAAANAGIVIAAVTGRSHFGGVELAGSTGARLDWFIGSNGGHRVKVDTFEIQERLLFDTAVMTDLLETLPREIEGIGFGLEHVNGFTFDDQFIEIQPVSIDGTLRRNSADRDLSDVGKWFIVHPEVTTVELVDLVAPYLPDTMHVTTSGVTFVEITPEGADKGSALARLCKNLGIGAHEVIAFGDNHNDLTMLEWAGRGVAMGNAMPAARAAADEITATNADFGVAQVLETLLENL